MMNLYHIVTAHGTLEVPAENEKEALRIALYPLDVEGIYAMPVTEEIQLDTEEWDFDHALGTVTYRVIHWADPEGTFYTVECADSNERMEEVDDFSISDIRTALTWPECIAFNDVNQAKQAIMDAIDETYDIYEDAIKFEVPDYDRYYEEARDARYFD